MRVHGPDARPMELPMKPKVGRDSVEPWNPLGAMNIRARRSLALPREISSWSRCMRKSERRLSMNHHEPSPPKRGEAATKVAQTSKSAVSRISKSAGHPNSTALPTWKSATQQVWKPALRYRFQGARFIVSRGPGSQLEFVARCEQLCSMALMTAPLRNRPTLALDPILPRAGRGRLKRGLFHNRNSGFG